MFSETSRPCILCGGKNIAFSMYLDDTKLRGPFWFKCQWCKAESSKVYNRQRAAIAWDAENRPLHRNIVVEEALEADALKNI